MWMYKIIHSCAFYIYVVHWYNAPLCDYTTINMCARIVSSWECIKRNTLLYQKQFPTQMPYYREEKKRKNNNQRCANIKAYVYFSVAAALMGNVRRSLSCYVSSMPSVDIIMTNAPASTSSTYHLPCPALFQVHLTF